MISTLHKSCFIPATLKIKSFSEEKTRLGSCSMVSQRFYKAATAATASISISMAGNKASSMMSWLDRHGQFVTHLKLSSADFVQVPQLPCQHLRHLELACCSVCLGLGRANLVGVCTGLTHLSLSVCCLEVGVGRVASIAAVGGLGHLEHLDIAWAAVAEGDNLATIDCERFAHSSRLTHLGMPGFEVGLVNEQHLLCSLPLLQELQLPHRGSTAAALAGMQHLQHLTRLQIGNVADTICAAITPGLAQATFLKSLSAHQCDLDPDILEGLKQLSQLALKSVSLRSTDQGDFAGAAALLASLAQLQQLQDLTLHQLGCQWPPASAAYGAITASSKLQKLELSDCTLPAGVWQHVFPLARRLSAMQVLKMRKGGSTGLDQATNTSCLEGLVRCCPSLQQLQVHIRPDSDFLPLAQLSALTRLHIFGASAPSIRSLAAAVTWLTGLYLTSTPDAIIRPSWLLPLTAFTQLDFMSCTPGTREVGSDDDPDEPELGEDKLWVTQGGGASPVWLQLLEYCLQDSECQPAAIQEVVLQLVEQKQRIDQQEQRLTAQEQQLAMLRRQVQWLMQLVKAHQQSG